VNEPDIEAILIEIKCPGVTIQLLWEGTARPILRAWKDPVLAAPARPSRDEKNFQKLLYWMIPQMEVEVMYSQFILPRSTSPQRHQRQEFLWLVKGTLSSLEKKRYTTMLIARFPLASGMLKLGWAPNS
jgi:hypothetical protein